MSSLTTELQLPEDVVLLEGPQTEDSQTSQSFKTLELDIDCGMNSDDEGEQPDFYDMQDWDYRLDSRQRKLSLVPSHGYKSELKTCPPKHKHNRKCVISSESKSKALDRFFNRLRELPSTTSSLNATQVPVDFGFYEYAKVMVCEMLNSGLLSRVNGIISNCAQAFIIHADVNQTSKKLPHRECAIKVAKRPATEGKDWAHQESANLTKLEEAGVACPKVIATKKNFLLMSFIGRNRVAAQTLNEANLSEEECDLAYNQVVDFMTKLYQTAKLIHCYLTEENVLWYEKQCYIISTHRAISVERVEGFKFLYRDCSNITRFFDRRGVENLKPASQLFKDICGCDISEALYTVSDHHYIESSDDHLIGKRLL